MMPFIIWIICGFLGVWIGRIIIDKKHIWQSPMTFGKLIMLTVLTLGGIATLIIFSFLWIVENYSHIVDKKLW